MIKQASTPIPLSPEELSSASNHFGRSLFSALQLAREQELQKRLSSAHDYADDDGEALKIPIPRDMMPSLKEASEADDGTPGILARAITGNNKPIRMLIEGQQGFGDARKEYYMQQKSQIQQELARSQKEYIDLLSSIKSGESTDTPCVDAFCNGLAYAASFGKKAEDKEVDISDGSIKRLLSGAAGVIKKPFQPAIDTAASGLLGTGVGAGYLTYLLRKKMRDEPDKYLQEQLPTRVELEPYA